MKTYQCVEKIDFAANMLAEIKMLGKEAAKNGYASIDLFITARPLDFQKITADWRMNHG
jgi:hypothetical protein